MNKLVVYLACLSLVLLAGCNQQKQIIDNCNDLVYRIQEVKKKHSGGKEDGNETRRNMGKARK